MADSPWHALPRGLAATALALTLAPACAAETYRADPSNYLSMLKRLRPGDRMLLATGEYRDGLPLHRVNGDPGKRIVISGPGGGKPATFLARPGANTVSIVDSSYVTLSRLVLDGQGLPVDAVKAEGHAAWAHHITLERLRIVNHQADQQHVGISTKCPAWNWVIRDNVIEAAGTGMYLGQSDGTAPFIAGLIERNVIVDSVGYNVQIKHQQPRPRIEGMPQERSITIIRHNVFSKSANSAVGKMARPNLLVGHWPRSGPGDEDTYAIYGNFFYQNPTEALFQGEGNFAFYSNVLVNPHGDAIRVQPHNDVPRRIDIFRNTVIAGNTGINVTGGHPDHVQRVTANAVFAAIPLNGGEQQENVTGVPGEAPDHLAEPYAPLGRLDLAPRTGRLTAASSSALPKEALPDLNRDFDGRAYADPIAGAYAAERAVWRLRLAPKPKGH